MAFGKSMRLELFISTCRLAKGSGQVMIVYGDNVRKSFNPETVSPSFIEKQQHCLLMSGVGELWRLEGSYGVPGRNAPIRRQVNYV